MHRRAVSRCDSRYKQLRCRNNASVKKSRDKSRRERYEIILSVKQLEEENQQIIHNLKNIKKEYEELQNIFKQQTGLDLDQLASSDLKSNSSSTENAIEVDEKENSTTSKSVLSISTNEDRSSSNVELDANDLDGSFVVINGVQYKIVSVNKN